MGAFGYGVWQNDYALDFKIEYEELLKKGHDTKSALKVLADKLNKESNPYEEVVLALTDLQINHACIVSEAIFLKAYDIVKDNKNFKNWSNPISRKAALKRFEKKMDTFVSLHREQFPNYKLED